MSGSTQVPMPTPVFMAHRSDDGPKLLQFANDCRKSGQFHDVIIKAGSEDISANRMVLSCYSDFFKSMFQTSMKEQYQETVEIKEFDGKAVKTLIDFMYTGSIAIDSENAMNVLSAADFLQIDEVKDFCFNYFESEMSPDNCLDIIKASYLFKPNSSLDDIYEYISENLNKIAESNKFKNLSKSDIISLIEKLDSSVTKEKYVFEAIIGWIEFDVNSRKQDFAELFRRIELDQISPTYLEIQVASNSHVKEDVQCLNLVMSAISQQFKELRKKETGTKVLSIGGNHWGSVIETHYIYGNSKVFYPPLPIELSYHSSVKFKNYIYCIGGTQDRDFEKTSQRVFRLNLLSKVKTWEEATSICEKKRFLGAAVFQKNLVIAGGATEVGYVDQTEMYDEVNGKWKDLSSLNHARSGHGLVCCGSSLYAVGGLDAEKKLTSSVERLHQLDGKWEFVASMHVARNCCAVVSLDGCIYAIGGQGKNGRLKSVEKYLPKEDRWIFVRDLTFERYRHAACVFRGRVLVIGGLCSSDEMTTEMECYNPASNSWAQVGEIKHDLYGHTLVVV